jgi:hypothetical protein
LYTVGAGNSNEDWVMIETAIEQDSKAKTDLLAIIARLFLPALVAVRKLSWTGTGLGVEKP